MKTSIKIAALAAISLGVGVLFAAPKSDDTQTAPACHQEQAASCPMMQHDSENCPHAAMADHQMGCHAGQADTMQHGCAMMHDGMKTDASCHKATDTTAESGHAGHQH